MAAAAAASAIAFLFFLRLCASSGDDVLRVGQITVVVDVVVVQHCVHDVCAKIFNGT